MRNFNVSKLNGLLPMRDHKLLHITRIKRLWYAVYIILHRVSTLYYGCKDERSKVYYTFQLKVRSTLMPQPATHDGCQQLFADQLLTDLIR